MISSNIQKMMPKSDLILKIHETPISLTISSGDNTAKVCEDGIFENAIVCRVRNFVNYER